MRVTLTDGATPVLQAFRRAVRPAEVRRAVGTACTRLTQGHLRGLGPNKRGWPSTGFYAGAAVGTAWNPTPTGVQIEIDNAARPGAMRQRYYGGTINMKDKLLTIPAAAAFYGQKATDFDNLRFAILGGHKALVVGKGGTGKVDFATGRSRAVKGAGVRAAAMVAYWLRESVDQDPDEGVLPTAEEYAEAAIDSVVSLAVKAGVK